MTTTIRERYEVRSVDVVHRVYVFVTSERRYHDACIAADTLRALEPADVVVMDAHEGRRTLYDSRLFTAAREEA